MSNAVLFYRPEAYSTEGQIVGRRAAGASFLEGFVRYGGLKTFYVTAPNLQEAQNFAAITKKLDPSNESAVFIPFHALNRAVEPGVIYRPDPLIGEQAWWRRRFGRGTFSLCGIAHTTASRKVQLGLAELVDSPTEEWDAVICPSRAVRSMIEQVLEAQLDYMAERFGTRRSIPIQLPIIPIGVNEADFAPTPARRKLGREMRERIGAKDEDIVLLFVGRLTDAEKLNPAVTYRALAEARKHTTRRLHMIWLGWFPSDKDRALFSEGARFLAGDVPVHVVDGQNPERREAGWHAADIFLSLVENVQETYGLVPVEAMAAGLPVVATDWDGYRDTVRHGENGFLVPTRMPPPGIGDDIGWLLESYAISYHAYLRTVSQSVTVDIEAAGKAIADLANNANLRRRLGAAGRRHVLETLDWKRIIPAYQALWQELNERRRKSGAPGVDLALDAPRRTVSPTPAALDPYRLFQSYPSATLTPDRPAMGGKVPASAGELFLYPELIERGLPRGLEGLTDHLDPPSQDNAGAWLAYARARRWFD